MPYLDLHPAEFARRALRGKLVAATVAAGMCSGCGASNDTADAGASSSVNVMTRNLYLGTDLTPLALLASPAAVPDAVAALWNNVQATDFPSRAQVLADEVTTLGPDLVALQEVALYRRQVPGDVASGVLSPNATDVALDFLALLLSEIDARGGGYRVAGEAVNGDAELPASDGAGGTFDLRLTDRDVILARDTVQTSNFVVAPFTAQLTLDVGGTSGLPISFARSTSHIDAVVGGTRLQFANSHLEIGLVGTVQLAQARELVDAYAQVTEPLLLLGDFNSAPGSESYATIVGAFDDAFTSVGTQLPGYTCCQAGDLRNPDSSADERIDLVLTRGRWRPQTLQVTGTDPASGRTPAGLWASDHFGVLATVERLP